MPVLIEFLEGDSRDVSVSAFETGRENGVQALNLSLIKGVDSSDGGLAGGRDGLDIVFDALLSLLFKFGLLGVDEGCEPLNGLSLAQCLRRIRG